MITLGDIFDKPKIELFANTPNTTFYNICKQRENEIKKTIYITIQTFNTHVQGLNKNKDLLASWKKDWITTCMTNLGSYLEYLINELDKEKIENDCKTIQSLNNSYVPFLPDLVLIMINSYHGAVETDLHWVIDLSLKDSMDISIGDFDFDKLKRYFPSRINEINSLFHNLKSISYVDAHSDTFLEAISCFKSNHQKASNLLLITIIEGLVRSLGIYLKEKQQLSINPSDKRKYASLESFLKKIPWKKDLETDIIKYGLITGKHSINKTIKEGSVRINLYERLGFLCRRFKENRNSILHGEETNYSNSLNSFLNFSALKEVLLTIKEYHALYD
jgi:hypothetical protein